MMGTLFNITLKDIAAAHKGVTSGRTVNQLHTVSPWGKQFVKREAVGLRDTGMNRRFEFPAQDRMAWSAMLASHDEQGMVIELRRTQTCLGRDYKDTQFVYYVTRHSVIASSMTVDYKEAKAMYMEMLLAGAPDTENTEVQI